MARPEPRPGGIVCLITDSRRLLQPDARVSDRTRAIAALAAAAAGAGIDLFQIREADLDGGALFDIARACVAAVGSTSTRVLVNDRLDVALAAGAHGVHLRSDSFGAREVRALVPGDFLVGRSVHDRAAALEAQQDGADFVIFGTVFPTGSKPAGHPIAGTEELAAVCRAVGLPVLAVGGVSMERVASVVAARARGVAAISMFAGAFQAGPEELRSLVGRLRRAFDTIAPVI
jgi:thiamine-phosphate pyrophosphorylase